MSHLRPVVAVSLPIVLGLALVGCGSLKAPDLAGSVDSTEADEVAATETTSDLSDLKAIETQPASQPAPTPSRSRSPGSASSTSGGAAPPAEPATIVVDYDGDEEVAYTDDLAEAGGERVQDPVGGIISAPGVPRDGQANLGPRRRGRDKSGEVARNTLEMKSAVGSTIGGDSTTTQRPPAPKPDPIATTAVRESQTEDYTDYGINGFTLTDRDRLSTFAADVDTASYTITRRKLREGYLPPAAAVRVEEFVNYFPYEYAQPGEGHPFAVDVEAAPSPFNPQNHIVRIGVQGKKVHFDTRRPVNLTFLVDVSGSMQSRDKIGLLKESLRMLTQELDDGDTVALVTYAGATKVVLAPTPISQRARILGALDGLTAGGSTAMGAGINLAYQQAEAGYRPGAVNRVIVASDGDANVGVTSHSQLSAFIAAKAKKGITLTTLGFGNGNYKDTMMERLANDGDGNYYYVDSLQESRRLFVDQLSSTLEVIAKDVKLQVEFNPDTVLAYRLIGYENRDVADKDFRNDAVDAGEIGAGHQVTALYEVALKDDLSGGLGTVRVRNKAPGPDSPAVERRYQVPESVIQSRFMSASPQFRLQTAAVGFAEILRGSPHMNEVSLRMVGNIARDAKRVEYAEDGELIELIDRAARLRGEGAVSRR